MNVCYSALFGNYEEIKKPSFITPGWKYILFTDQKIVSSVWQIVHIPSPESSVIAARLYKILLFKSWERSIWVDASFIIDTDLNLWWETYFQKGFSAPKHPLRNDVYEECLDCIISGRGVKKEVQAQMKEYKELKIPKNNGLIQSGILMRENSQKVIELCDKWWAELATHSTRDQIAFCKVSLDFKDVVHTYPFDYRKEKDFIYRKHFHKR